MDRYRSGGRFLSVAATQVYERAAGPPDRPVWGAGWERHFSGWEGDGFQRGFERLLRDLQMGDEAPPKLPSRFTEPIKDDTPQSLRRQLARHCSNLNKLQEDAAIYGAGEVPLHLQNQIEDEKRKIAEIEAELAELEGIKDKGGP